MPTIPFSPQTFVSFTKYASTIGLLPTSKSFWKLLLKKLRPTRGGKQLKRLEKLAAEASWQSRNNSTFAAEVEFAATRTHRCDDDYSYEVMGMLSHIIHITGHLQDA